jgi:hypothetical protein
MPANESPQASYLQVLTDEQGNILAAALRTVGVASIPGEDVPPQVSLVPSEAQVVHELSIPSGGDGDEFFNSINQWVVQVDGAGAVALVPRTGA